MDWASVAGLVLALGGILFGQLIEGGHLSSLVQPAAFVVVFIGTIGAVLLQSGLPNFVRGVQMIRWIFVPPPNDYVNTAKNIGIWSLTARREGLLSLEKHMLTAQNPFTAKGLRMLIDGIDPFKLKEILEVETTTYEQQQRLSVKIWDAAGGYAPTIGILGAVLGLIHVMENLADPSRLGSGIAVAFVATIYGVGLANLLFLPIANKLKMIVAREVSKREMMTDALVGIALGENPRVIEERISAYRDRA